MKPWNELNAQSNLVSSHAAVIAAYGRFNALKQEITEAEAEIKEHAAKLVEINHSLEKMQVLRELGEGDEMELAQMLNAREESLARRQALSATIVPKNEALQILGQRIERAKGEAINEARAIVREQITPHIEQLQRSWDQMLKDLEQVMAIHKGLYVSQVITSGISLGSLLPPYCDLNLERYFEKLRRDYLL